MNGSIADGLGSDRPTAGSWMGARWLALAALAVLGGLLSGCSNTQTHSFALTVPSGLQRLAVDVENYRGHVEVIADPNVRRATVDGWIWLGADAKNAGGEEPYALTSIEASIERAPDSFGSGVLRVRTSTEHSRFHDHHVRLVIRAPRIDGLRVINREGYVQVVEAGGAVHIENTSGGVQFRSSKPMTDSVRVLVTDTNVWYQVPAGSTGQITLETFDGRAVYKDELSGSDGTYTTASQEGTGGTIIRTVLGGGGNPVDIRTNRGDVRLMVMEDPVAYKRNFYTVMPDLRNYIKQSGSRRYTRNLPEDDYLSEYDRMPFDRLDQ